MVDIATLGLAVDSRQVKAARRDLDELTKSGRRTERQTDQIGQAFRRLAAPLAAYLGARQIAESAEQWTTLNNRLRLVTDSTEEFLAAQDDVFRIAQSSRQPLQATAELYQRIATNADELQLSGAGVAAVVDTINKTLAISGTSGASAQAALVQLGQAFASGTLRGEELNSVLEQAPALAKAIAEGMGVSVGQLRALGQEGVLTAQNVIDALLSQAEAVDSQFSTIQRTAGQAFTVLGNSLTRLVGEFDTATGASAAFADKIVELSEYLDSGALTGAILDSLSLWRISIAATEDSLADMSSELQLLGDVGSRSIDLLGDALTNLPNNVRSAVQIVAVETANIVSQSLNNMTAMARIGSALIRLEYGEIAAILNEREQSEQSLAQARQDTIQSIMDEHVAITVAADAERRRREDERAARAEARAEREKDIAALRAGAEGVTLPSVGTDKVSREAEREAKRLLDAYKNLEASLLEQIALHGDTSEAASLRYQLEQGDLQALTDDEKEHLLALREKLDLKDQETEKARELQEVLDSLRTEEEAAIESAAELYRILGEAFQRGALPLDEYLEAVGRVGDGLDSLKEKGEETGEELSEFSKQAARNMQDAFADFLFDPFEEGLDGLLNNFARILQRMAAEAAAAAIFDSLGFAGGGQGGGFDWAKVGSTIGSWFAGGFDGGGFTGAGPRVGGLDGKGGMLAMVHPNETIIDHTRGQSAGTTVQVGQMVFPNVTTERQAREATGAAARSLSRIAGAGQRYS